MGGFSLAAFMAGQSDGFWFDFAQTDRLFQEQCGPTPADDPNEVIGLALSQRLWNGQTRAAYLTSQPNIATVSTQAAVSIGGPTFTNYTVTPVLTSGRTYEISFDVAGYAGTGSVGVAGAAGNFEPDLTGESLSANGTVRVYGTMQVTGSVALFSRSTNTCTFTNISVKEVTRQPATQATASLKPKVQPEGAKFDGSDDNLLSGYTAGAAANFLVAKVTIPASVPSSQVIAGVTSGSGRFYVGVNTSGQVGGGAGDLATSGLFGGADLRGRTVVVGISADAGVVRLFADGALITETAYTGAPVTGRRFALGGATGSSDVISGFFGGSIKATVAGRQHLDTSTFNQIAAAL